MKTKLSSKIIALFLSILFCFNAMPVWAIETLINVDENTENTEKENAIDNDDVIILCEDVTRREEYTKHFKLNNGTYLAVQYNQPIHTLNDNSEWVESNPTFVFEPAKTEDDFDGYVKKSNDKDIKISNSTEGMLLNIIGDDEGNALSLQMNSDNANIVSAQIIQPSTQEANVNETPSEKNERIINEVLNTSILQFSNVFENIDFIYDVTHYGVEGKLVLNNSFSINEFDFILDISDLSATLDSYGNVNISDDKGAVIYSIAAPYLYDAENKIYNIAQYSLSNTDDGKYILKISIDNHSINADNITYPLTLKSDIIVATDNTLYDEVLVSSADPDSSNISKTGITVGKIDDVVYRTYLRFNKIPSLKSTDIFISAKFKSMQYYEKTFNEEPSLSIAAYSIIEEWDVNTVTWNTQPMYSDRILCAKEFNENYDIYEMGEWNITEDIRKNYENNPSYGIVLISTNEANMGYMSMLSSKVSSPFCPYLFINYVPVIQDDETITPTDIEENTHEEDTDKSVLDDDIEIFEEVSSSIILNESNSTDSISNNVESEISEITTTEGDFKEVTSDITMTYSVGGTWSSLSNGVIVDQIDGIRIQTDDTPYYLKYKSRNTDKGWLDAVYSYNSGAYDYAGWHNYAMTNLAIEVYEGSTRVYDNYVVMYRAYVDGEWLDWVSNGEPEVMQDIKTQFNLTGNLDTAATDAGWYTRGNIQGLIIRVFERIGYSGTSSSSGTQFQEITDFTQEYYLNRTWNNLNSETTLDQIDGIRLGTDSKEYYFKYRSRNVDKGWLDYVYSYNSGTYDYAGWPDYPMTNLAIEVYDSNNTRIYDDYVVMYRVKVADEWLDWVSNGQPEVMQTIMSEFNLDGNIDTSATDAGWYSKGNIQSIEIRMFERIGSSSGGSSDIVETDAFQAATGISMEYYKNRTFTTFNNTIEIGSIDGVRFRTNGKPYYFKYRVKDASHGWLDFVTSNSTNTSDYAGWPNYPITHIEIQVYTLGGTRIYDDYVVMYRAKVAGEWLDWVSNGAPAVMESIKTQFNLDGNIDTVATDAGWASRGNIESLEIRVYERKGLSVNPSEDAVIIKAPYINQDAIGLPNGCESVSTVMALQYYKMPIDSEQFVTKYLDMGPAPIVGGIGPDPAEVYAGDPHKEKGGWGCYAPVIVNAVNKYIDTDKYTVMELSGQSLESICSTYIDNGIPVIIWATVDMTEQFEYRYWTTSTGKSIAYNNKLHCLLLVGYDDEKDLYYINDPLMPGTGEYVCVEYTKSEVENAYNTLNQQAVVIIPKDEVTEDDTNDEIIIVTPPPTETIKIDTEISKSDSLEEEHIVDPIDLSIGAHIIDHNLMTVYGAQTLKFQVHYSSNLETVGSLGMGWSHNYEKKIVDDGSTIKVYDNVTYYALYTKSNDDSNLYTTNTITKNNYTVTKTANGYIVNCNKNLTEYYDVSGKLYKITSKSGFNTLIEYPSDSTIKIIDEISGRYMIISKDNNGRVISVADNTGRICTLEYTEGCLTSITDENNNTISYLYNENKQIERGMDEDGTVYFRNTYDSLKRVIRQKDAVSGNLETVINYDDSLSDYTLVTVYDRMLNKTVYKYNSSKQLVSKIDANGIETTYEYDNAGNLTKKTDGLGYSVIDEFDGNNNLISTTDKLGRKTEYTYDGNNNLTKITYPNGSIVTSMYDSNNRLVSSTDIRGVVTTYEYDTLGQLTKTTYLGKSTEYEYQNGQVSVITDRLGRETTNQYSTSGFLISCTDSQNNTTYYTHDNKGNILNVTDAKGNVTTKEYDANGNLVKTTDAKGNATTYTYNGNLKITSMTLPTGVSIYYKYNSEDKLVCITYPNGTTTESTYDAGGRVITETDKNGNITSFEYDTANNIVKITDANGGITVKEYDAAGNVTKSTDSLGNSTIYEYDNMGNLIKVTNAIGGVTQYTYNAAGDLLTVTDPLGNTTTNSYDNRGNLITVTDPRGYTTSYAYDEMGNIVAVTNALNQTTTNTYDSLNRLVSTTDPGNHTTTYEYDELGRLTSTTDAKGNATHQYYDVLGNIIKVTDQSNNIDYEVVYDEGGRAVKVTDAIGSVTLNEYDYAGNLTKQIDALGYIDTYTYDGNGNMTSSVDSLGGVSYATYDGVGNLTSMTGPAGSLKEYVYNSVGLVTLESTVTSWDNKYTYNALGLVIKKVGASNARTTYNYDAAGRLVSYTETSGNISYTVSYTYDANGNILTVTDESGTVTREYDALNRVTRYIDTLGNVILYEYDSCGNLSKMTYPNGEQGIYTYDANHNMISTSLANSTDAITYEYNKQNQVTKIYRPDGSVCTKSYDKAGRLTNSTDLDANGDFVVVDSYMYDSLGRIKEEINLATYSRYIMEYDSLGRLVKRTEKDLRYNSFRNEETFTYDAAGNILTDSDGNTFTYTENNVIKTANGTTYFTDAKGNSTWTPTEKFVSASFDLRNRLTAASSNKYQYTYDAENNRVSMTYETTSMQYTHDTSDGRNRLIWTKDQDNVETIYGYGADGIVWSLCNGEYKFYHYDYRGSVKAVTSIDGTITDTIKYDVYGCVEERTGESELIIGYNGEYGVLSDSNGLLYMRARYYNPSLKRFMSADIITGSISDSTTLNLFAYVNGNPISFVDPFGLTAERADGNSSISYDDVSFGVHTTLDVAGMIPVIGMFADGANAIYYACEGDWGNALFSAFSFIPIVGDISATGKVVSSGVKIADKALDAAKVADKVSDTTRVVNNLDNGVKYFDEFVDISKGADVKTKPYQVHHFATDKNKCYTELFEKYTNKYNLNLDDDWNKELLPHQGRHPNAYHEFVLDEIKKIDNIANGDQKIFLDLYEQNVKNIIRENPDMLYSAYWKSQN